MRADAAGDLGVDVGREARAEALGGTVGVVRIEGVDDEEERARRVATLEPGDDLAVDGRRVDVLALAPLAGASLK